MKQTTLGLLALTAVLSGGGLYLVMSRMGPYDETAWLSLTLFAMSSFVCAASVFTLIGALARLFLYREETYFFHFLIALRQGLLLAFFLVGYLALSSLEVATWWNLVLFLISLFFVELYFLNREVTK